MAQQVVMPKQGNSVESCIIVEWKVKPGDKVILTLGVPVLERGTTNALRVYTICREDVERLSDDALPTRFKKDQVL